MLPDRYYRGSVPPLASWLTYYILRLPTACLHVLVRMYGGGVRKESVEVKVRCRGRDGKRSEGQWWGGSGEVDSGAVGVD